MRKPGSGLTAPPEPRAPPERDPATGSDRPAGAQDPPPQAATRSQGQSAPVHSARPQGASAWALQQGSLTISRKQSGDIELNGSAKASNHCNTNTKQVVSGVIGLTILANESSHCLENNSFLDQCVGPVDPSN